VTNADHAIILRYSGEPYDEGRSLPPLSFTGLVLYGGRPADALAFWSRQVAKQLEQACYQPSWRVLCIRKMEIAFRFVHIPWRSAYPPAAHSMPSRLRRSQMPCDKSSRVSSATFYLPLTSAGEAAPRPPYSSHMPPDSSPVASVHSISLPDHFPRVAGSLVTSIARCASPPRYHSAFACACGESWRSARAHPPELGPSGGAGCVDSLWPQGPVLPGRGSPYDRPSCASGPRTPDALAGIARPRGRPWVVEFSRIWRVPHFV